MQWDKHILREYMETFYVSARELSEMTGIPLGKINGWLQRDAPIDDTAFDGITLSLFFSLKKQAKIISLEKMKNHYEQIPV